jgi:hypothetical protein
MPEHLNKQLDIMMKLFKNIDEKINEDIKEQSQKLHINYLTKKIKYRDIIINNLVVQFIENGIDINIDSLLKD